MLKPIFNSGKLSILISLLIVVILPVLSDAQQVLKPYVKPLPQDICGTMYLTDEKLAEIALNTSINHPEYADMVLRQPAWLSKGNTAEAAVGDSAQFWVVNFETDENYRIWAELKAVGEHVMVWVAKSDTNVTDEHITQLFSDLETSTPPNSIAPEKGIMQILHDFFGDEPDYDGDGFTDILLFDIQDGFNPPIITQFIAGYFNPGDQNTTQLRPYSNERDLLYLDTYPAVSNDLLSVTSAHELQHLIHYNYDIETELVNEGASQLSQSITGFEWDDPTRFFDGPPRSLTAWADNTDPMVLTDYVKVQMFMLYLFEQFGGDFIKTLVQQTSNGLGSVGDALDVHGETRNVSDVLHDWFIANYINDVDFDPRYGYSFPAARIYNAGMSETISDYPANLNGSLPSYSADYFKLRNGMGMEIDYTASTAECLAIKEVNGLYEIIRINPGVTFEDSTFGDAYNELILITKNGTSINSSYSYTFDSQQPFFIMEMKYDDGSPDVIFDQVRALQLGTNTPGYQWAVKFSPLNDESYLLGARIHGLTIPESFGSGKFNFHVYDNTGPDGQPGSDIIEPFPVTFVETLNFYWLDVDLTGYSDQLSQYHDDFYIAIEHPLNDTNTVAIALDNSTPDEDMTWLYLALGDETAPSWTPMANLALNSGGNRYELDDFDAMFRAEMSFLETARPSFLVGYLQHPVFTENFEIYIIGEKQLERDRLSASYTINSTTRPMVLVSTGSTGRVYVDNNVTITENGQVEISVTGGYKYSFTDVDTTISFNVQSVDPGIGNKISSPDGKKDLIVGGSLTKRTTLTAFDGYEFRIIPFEETENKSAASESVGKPVAFGPGSLSGDFKLSFRFTEDDLNGRDPTYLRICRLESNRWVPLETVPGDNPYEILAKTSQLGTFQLRWSAEYSALKPLEYALDQNYPNPFNAGTRIGFSLKNQGKVTLKIYDLTGREIRTLVSEDLDSGRYVVDWDGTNDFGRPVSSGMYIYRIQSRAYESTRKLVLLK